MSSSGSSSSARPIDPRIQELLDQLDNLLVQVLNVQVADDEETSPETCNRLRILESQVDDTRARIEQLLDTKQMETEAAIKKLVRKP